MLSSSGEWIRFDNVVLATGSAPFVPPIPGVQKPGVFVYRTIEDLVAIREYAKTAKSARCWAAVCSAWRRPRPFTTWA